MNDIHKSGGQIDHEKLARTYSKLMTILKKDEKFK